MPKFTERLRHAWNAFLNGEEPSYSYNIGTSYAFRPDRVRLTRGNERSIVNSIYNRIAMDVAAVNIKHVRLDQNDRYVETINSKLNYALNTEANIDQTGRAFIQDVVLSMFDEGVVAVVPVDTDINPKITGSFEILSMRTAKIVEWFPEHVRVRLYNDKTGRKEEVTLPKKTVAIIENPLYSVMNEPNSTLQRLIRKLNILDAIDEQSGAGKLDLIIQLPYTIKTEARKKQAEERRKDIEQQLANTKYGIAYADATEHITQLNRSLDNNLMKQIEYLTSMLYGQLGFTEELFNGKADEQTSMNYYSNIVEPILSAITSEMSRKFLTRTARTQHQSIVFFRDPFKLVPVSQIADIADKFTRNEVLSSNEVRALIGFKPVDDERANELRNKNLNQSPDAEAPPMTTDEGMPEDIATEEEPVEEEEVGGDLSDFGKMSIGDLM